MKIKDLIVFITLIFVVGAINATNCFEPGTVWTYQGRNNAWRLETRTITLNDATDPDENPCYRMDIKTLRFDHQDNPVSINDPKDGWLIKIEDDKVYCYKPWASAPHWKLVCDFSLEIGQGCYVPQSDITEEYTDQPVELPDFYFKYVGDVAVEHYDIEAMELKVFRSEEESNDDANAIKTEYWFRGLGNLYDFTGNYNYSGAAGYFALPLQKVVNKEGETLLEYKDHSGITPEKADELHLPAAIYDLLGRKVNNPTDGVFIRVQGSKAEKVRL